MTREDSIKYADIIKAFQEGKEIQGRKIGTTTWYDRDLLEFQKGYEYQIKPEKIVRLPSKRQVFQWFKENKVFKIKTGDRYTRIELIVFLENGVIDIKIGSVWMNIEAFVMSYTDEHGKSLMITPPRYE